MTHSPTDQRMLIGLSLNMHISPPELDPGWEVYLGQSCS